MVLKVLLLPSLILEVLLVITWEIYFFVECLRKQVNIFLNEHGNFMTVSLISAGFT